jgi:predicted O-methyltransferase YrrM
MSERGNDYTNVDGLPPLVAQAAELARTMQFANSCAVPYGRLLEMLAAHEHDGYIGEIGTGCGVGTAWMVSGANSETRIVTIEQDAAQVSAAQTLFADHANVTVLHGDGLELAAHGPFDLLYADAMPGKHHSQEVAVSMVRPGGMIVIDDLTVGETNGLRSWWLSSPLVASVEIALDDDFAAILAVRR